jgi:DNA-binding beta-propeller fold protein YncE
MSVSTDWKGIIVIALSVAILGVPSCGGPGGPSLSHLAHRAFVSDNFDGTLHIEDAAHDVESGFTIATGAQPGVMALSPDKTITLVFDMGSGTLSVVKNSTESVLGRILLPATSTSYVSMSDDTVGFAAVPNCPVASCSGNANVVEVVDLMTTFNITNTVPITHAARTLVLSPSGSKLLVLPGVADHQDTVTVIDTAKAKTTPLPADTATAISTFDRPVFATFASDGSTAFVLNCGPECGGVSAGVAVLDMTASPPAVRSNVVVPGGATVALLNGTTLYVAGTSSGAAGAGQLSVLTTGSLTSPASSVGIGDGTHTLMALASDNKLFIGASGCTNGCLSIFDAGANKAVVDSNTLNVTGIAPIGGRNVVYVVEDVVAGSPECLGQLACQGELRIYDTTKTTPTLTPTQIDVVGRAVDVKSIDQ